jgi:aminoglycoside phosphotransferase (APT) family kinase protein
MPLFSVSAHEVEVLASEILETTRIQVEQVPIGFGNDNWRVTDTADRSYVLKVGPNASAAKWDSARNSYELAASVGVPLPALVYFAQHDDYVVRMFEWIDGGSPIDIAHDPMCVSTLFTTLGTAIASLHSIELDAFSSRLDGSAPSFRRWADYVDYRLHQIRDRCSDQEVLDAPTVERACAAISDLADEVSGAARPTLCHRDLYADNLVVDEHGTLLAILDWDMAEAWDPAAEWFKLDWLLFPDFPGAEATFNAAYHAVHAEPVLWARRKRLVDLMETLNTIANARAQSWNAHFDVRARLRLQALLDAPDARRRV